VRVGFRILHDKILSCASQAALEADLGLRRGTGVQSRLGANRKITDQAKRVGRYFAAKRQRGR
jgi:hypothetical protein